MKNAVLVTHGPIGEAIIVAVKGIMGVEDGLHALEVTNMSVTEISQRLFALVSAPEEQEDGVIIMASLRGGSCWNVSVAVSRDYKNVRVVSGVNLPMVLSFMTKRDSHSLDELTGIVKHDAEKGITRS